jgi:diguanylate cyclase (GGDEF)-like protein
MNAVVSPFPQEERAQTDRAEGMWDPWKGPTPGSFGGDVIRSPYTLLEGLGSGAAKGQAVLGGLLHTQMSPDTAQMASEGLSPDAIARAKSQADEMQQHGADAFMADARERVKALTPDAATTGTATQVLHSVASGAEQLILGSLSGVPGGGALAVGSGEGVSRYQDLKEQGVDSGTARASAAVTAITAGAGALVPAAYGSSLATRLLTGAGSNTAFGMVNRGADHLILQAGGYQEMADQQKVWDGTQMLVDAALGATFGAVHHASTPAEAKVVEALKQNRDAALTANLALKDRAAAPGIPINPESASVHAAALEKATQDVLQGKPIDVADSGIDQAAFLERPAPDDRPPMEVMAAALKESGFLDEEANLRDLEAQFERRMGGETERRSDSGRRQTVNDMSPEQLRQELLTHELTGIPNRRAYAESDKLPAQVSVDVDSLKWVNDNLGHEAGDQMLKTVAASLAKHTPEAYHVSGDEFIAQARTPEEAHATMAQVTQHLKDHVMEVTMPDGSVRKIQGLGVSYGVGKDLHEADTALQVHKATREAAGHRAARGEVPPGAVEGSGEPGRQADANRPAGGSGPAGVGDPVTQALAERPNLKIPTEDGQTVKASDALEAAQSKDDWTTAVKAAVNCFSRRGG